MDELQTPDGSVPHAIALVAMPWNDLDSPSMQIGVLEAVLRRASIPCRSFSLHLEFAAFAARRSRARAPFRAEHYGWIAETFSDLSLGEWLFKEAASSHPDNALSREDRDLLGRLQARGADDDFVARLMHLRAETSAFAADCASAILAISPAAVAFTLTYQQTIPSLAVARELKQRAPHLPIVIGGASCDGPMGEALLRVHEPFDIAFSGEAELAAPALFSALIAGEPAPLLPGVRRREVDGTILGGSTRAAPPPIDSVPLPEYGDYFTRLEDSPFAGQFVPKIPFESARGCWWGERSHCTFCGLNGNGMAFRSKRPERVLDELRELSMRHRALDFFAVDNIVDLDYFESLFPALAASGLDLRLFYETKSNLTREQVRVLRSAGVLAIQPGIESLSTPILRRIKKGVTAAQNVRLLRHCAESGVRVVWNLIYGFPNEPIEEYELLVAALPALVHLSPPRCGPLFVDRFSPYFVEPERHGLEISGPLPVYAALHEGAGEHLRDLAPSFAFRYLDGRDPSLYSAPLRQAVADWASDHSRNVDALTFRRGPDFVEVVDRRTNGEPARIQLDGVEAAVFAAIQEIATPRAVRAKLDAVGLPCDETAVRTILSELVAARLAFVDEDRYVSLALCSTPAPRSSYRFSDAEAFVAA